MNEFTFEETNLMCIYNTGSREGLITALEEMQEHLEADETELKPDGFHSGEAPKDD